MAGKFGRATAAGGGGVGAEEGGVVRVLAMAKQVGAAEACADAVEEFVGAGAAGEEEDCIGFDGEGV